METEDYVLLVQIKGGDQGKKYVLFKKYTRLSMRYLNKINTRRRANSLERMDESEWLAPSYLAFEKALQNQVPSRVADPAGYYFYKVYQQYLASTAERIIKTMNKDKKHCLEGDRVEYDDNSRTTLMDTVADSNNLKPDEQTEMTLRAEACKVALFRARKRLPETELQLLDKHFVNKETQKKCEADLNLTSSQYLEKLRNVRRTIREEIRVAEAEYKIAFDNLVLDKTYY